MQNLTIYDFVAFVLVIVGALNWGLVGLFKFDVVAALFGNASLFTRVVYSLVGLAGLWTAYKLITCACNKDALPVS